MSRVDWRANDADVIAFHEADVRRAGFGEAWDHILAQPATGERGILLGCLGAVATYMRETGLSADASP